jgi:DNA-binding MarR family transcriptional regulator
MLAQTAEERRTLADPSDRIEPKSVPNALSGESLIYLEVITLAEHLHRQFLEVISLELERRGVRDINSVRALILLNIGTAEMTATELMLRGCYLGSNVSYNLKKLTEAGYVTQKRSAHDLRVVIVCNSPKGLELCAVLEAMSARHLAALSRSDFNVEDLGTCRRTLRALQQFWSRTIQPTRMRQPS